jgi:hypothetical protein
MVAISVRLLSHQVFFRYVLGRWITNSIGDTCSSREDAKKHLLKSPFFKAWDHEVLYLYLQYGMVNVPASEGGGVRLKMTGFQVCTKTLRSFDLRALTVS